MLTHTVSVRMPEARSYIRVDGSCPFEDAFDCIKDTRAQAKIDTVVRKLERGLRTRGPRPLRARLPALLRERRDRVGDAPALQRQAHPGRGHRLRQGAVERVPARKSAAPPKAGQPGPKPLLRPEEDNDGADA